LGVTCLLLTFAASPATGGAEPVPHSTAERLETGIALPARDTFRVAEQESGNLTTYLVGLAGLLLVQYAGVRRMRIALASLASALPQVIERERADDSFERAITKRYAISGSIKFLDAQELNCREHRGAVPGAQGVKRARNMTAVPPTARRGSNRGNSWHPKVR
jgi:hypothetical protein